MLHTQAKRSHCPGTYCTNDLLTHRCVLECQLTPFTLSCGLSLQSMTGWNALRVNELLICLFAKNTVQLGGMAGIRVFKIPFAYVSDVPRKYAMSVCGAVWESCVLRMHLGKLACVSDVSFLSTYSG